MQDLGAFIVNLIVRLWPFCKVEPWEEGLYIVFGRAWKVVGPGYWWPVIPWFVEVVPVNTRPSGCPTQLQTVTIDGETTSYSAVALLRVFDIRKALMNVQFYKSSTTEMLPGWINTMLWAYNNDEMDANDIAEVLSSRLEHWGIECLEFKFTNFVSDVFTVRALTDQAIASTDW